MNALLDSDGFLDVNSSAVAESRVESQKGLDGERNKLSPKNSAFDDPMQK
jgi:hypothetical protein